ncbi:MAG: molybdopterin cofactor-binding domain-containing protein [Chitinophagaceae bacterium]
MPICFGISFTKTMMNQARALVHVYTDGSVSVSTGAVEMGQGVNTKMVQVAATYFVYPFSKDKNSHNKYISRLPTPLRQPQAPLLTLMERLLKWHAIQFNAAAKTLLHEKILKQHTCN